MKLNLIHTDRSFDVVSLCPLFFPRDGFSEEKGKILTVIREEDRYRTVFEWNGTEYTSEYPIRDQILDAERTALKRAVYQVLSKATGITSPWGILSGVRPLRFYETVREAYGAQTADIMEEEYLVDRQKTELCRSVLEQQQAARRANTPNSAALYLSIPFCPSRCKYCSFVSQVTGDETNLIPEYLHVLKEEIAARLQTAAENGDQISTAYLGGGTPTTLTASQLNDLLKSLAKHIDLSGLLEFTVEAGRPDTIDPEKLAVLEANGVTRISVNPQTLDDGVLQLVGRRHTVADFYRAYEQTRKTSLDINVDLIAGLPGDTPEKFDRTMSEITALAPENLTVHTLYLKRAADYGAQDAELFTQNTAQTVEMVRLSQEHCRKNGYLPYYLYRQKNTVGNLENVGYAKKGKENYYNIYMMDDLQTIYGAGANAITKTVRNGTVSRSCNTKYAYNYIKEKWK